MISDSLALACRSRSVDARKLRIENYQRLIFSLRQSPMRIDDMCALLGVSAGTGRKYHLTLLQRGIVHPIHQKSSAKGSRCLYQCGASVADIKAFLTFIASCISVDDEIGSLRRIREEPASPLVNMARRTVKVGPAQQVGMWRDSLVCALFGPARGETA